MPKLEFFFDCSSPWTYLAFSRVQAFAAGAEIIWRPILVGGVFNAVNTAVYERRAKPEPRQKRYFDKDMQDWARLCGVKIVWPPSVFPVNSVKAMRGAYHAIDQGRLVPYATEVFQAYWGDNRDISDVSVLRACAERAGLEGSTFLTAVDAPENKDRLRQATQDLIDRGGFGSPTMFIGEDMYFGNDRLPLVEAALKRAST
ncbi:2-hydroxychromene-2-carboxylate isomerase [Alphaproteobacteria bacterium SO-S41]|nr:2-hydroxychromene-2-carboxylate isomerase [Alphaproteobacteria bacterium SO-S41]